MKVIPFTIPVPKNKSIIVEEDRLPYFYNFLHRHQEIQLTWIIKGEGTLIAGNYTQHFQAGDIYIIGANQPHIFKSDPAYFDKRKKLSVHSMTIFFSEKGELAGLFQLPEMKKVQKWIALSSNGYKITEENKTAIIDMINMVHRTEGAQQVLHFINLLHQLSSLKQIQPLSTAFQEQLFTEAEGLRLNNIYQYTLQHFDEPIALQQVADIAHFTVPAFCRYFKKRTRKTYISFLNEVRINEACKLLLSKKLEGIAAIAYSCGFSNVSSFNRTFKQVTGKSPREYLRQLG
jgi:YesN/AraC family two-component response regulator